MRGLRVLALVGGVALAIGCDRGATPRAAPPMAVDSQIPDGALGAAIRRGRALVVATRDSLPRHVGNRLRCVSCHLDEGRRPATGSWVGVYVRYPQYRARSATVETIEYRVNDCFRRSMNGAALPADGSDMRDIVAYLWFLARGVVVASRPQNPNPLARWAAFHADTAAGATVYAAVCAKCHGLDGAGTTVAPPVWGPGSFNIGAGMSRLRTATAFIRDNMPFDQPGSLTDQQAFDVAAFVTTRPRPDFPDKIADWPHGDAPPDVAYPTRAARRTPSPSR